MTVNKRGVPVLAIGVSALITLLCVLVNYLAPQQALEMLKTWPYPVVAQLRDTQAYVVLVGLGRSLFDYHSAQVREHQADWEPLLKWLGKA